MSELDPIATFTPWAGPEERALRVRIHKARDAAQARAARSKHGRARTLWWVAAQLASDWVFHRAPVDDLQEIISGLGRLFLVAGMIERLEAPDND
jgi:muconolactone delta-isomerase